jgi:hypothetical protein
LRNVKANSIRNKMQKLSQASVAYACNPSYSGGRDQEDCCLKLAWANSSQDPISEKPITRKKKKKVGGVAQSIGPEFKPQFKPSEVGFSTI